MQVSSIVLGFLGFCVEKLSNPLGKGQISWNSHGGIAGSSIEDLSRDFNLLFEYTKGTGC